jgi:hypothetical protein
MISCPLFAASINPYHSHSEIQLVLIAFPPWTSEPSYAIFWFACSTNIESEWLDIAHYPLRRCNIIIPMMGLNGRTIRVCWDCRYTRIIGLYQRHFGAMQARRVIVGGHMGHYSNHAFYFSHPFLTYQWTEFVPRFLRWPAISDPSGSGTLAESSYISEDYTDGLLPVDPFGMGRGEGKHGY